MKKLAILLLFVGLVALPVVVFAQTTTIPDSGGAGVVSDAEGQNIVNNAGGVPAGATLPTGGVLYLTGFNTFTISLLEGESCDNIVVYKINSNGSQARYAKGFGTNGGGFYTCANGVVTIQAEGNGHYIIYIFADPSTAPIEILPLSVGQP
jgi:hypothetical protein